MKNYKKSHFFAAAAPLFLIIFIDAMGLGLVFPILSALVTDPSGTFFATPPSDHVRTLIFGVVTAIYMFCWFFGAAFLGDLSDHIGRKKSLMICLLGAFVGFLLAAFSVTLHSFSLLIISRIIAGFTSGSQPIAQAAIVDLSDPDHKARNLGWMLFVLSLGFVGGPLLGGLLSDSNVSPYFTLSTPFYFAALISLLNAILLKFYFHETFKHFKKVKIKLHGAIEIFISAFTHIKVRKLSFIFAIFIFGWSSFYSFISLFLLKTYNFSITDLSLFMAALGLGFGIGSSVLVNYFTHRYSLKHNAVVSILLGALFTAGIVIVPHPISAWLLIVPMGCVMSLTYSAVLTIFSNQVSAEHQGWIMGITGSIMAFVWGVNALTVGMLADVNPQLPLVVCAISLACAGLLMQLLYKGTK